MEGRSISLLLLGIIFLNGCESTQHEKDVDSSKITPRPVTVNSIAIPKDYTLFPDDNVAYKIYKDRMTWKEARDRCISDGGNLAITDTLEKIKRVVSLDSKIGDFMFVGFYKPNGSEEWIRADNELPVTSLPWKYVLLSHPKSDCAAIANGFQIIEIPCTWKRLSVCEINYATDKVNGTKVYTIETTTQASSLSSSDLPEGYTIYPHHDVAYKIYNDEMTWEEARNRCISDGGNLAIADTQGKIQFMTSLSSDKNHMFFVGFYRPAHSKAWLRVDNGSSVKSLPWGIKPAVDSMFDCAVITGDKLISLYCELKLRSICEIHPSVDDTSSAADGQKYATGKKIYLHILFYFLIFIVQSKLKYT